MLLKPRLHLQTKASKMLGNSARITENKTSSFVPSSTRFIAPSHNSLSMIFDVTVHTYFKDPTR